MNDRIRQLVEAAQAGGDPEYNTLLEALRTDATIDAAALVLLCSASESVLRAPRSNWLMG